MIFTKTNPSLKLPEHKEVTATQLTSCLENKKVSPELMEILNKYVDELVYVSEDQISLAVAYLSERGKIIASSEGAAGFAAIINNKFEFRENEKIVSLVSGGNIPMSMLARSVERMLYLTNKRILFKVVLPYGTKHLAILLKILVKLSIQVVDCITAAHVNIPANQESYTFVADVPNDIATENLQNELNAKGWRFSLSVPEEGGKFIDQLRSNSNIPKKCSEIWVPKKI